MMSSIQQLKWDFLAKKVQFLLFNDNGYLIESCDSLFKTNTLKNLPISQWGPFFESISHLFPALKKGETPLHFYGMETPLPHLTGFYDVELFRIEQKKTNPILITIYELTTQYTKFRHLQQQLNNSMITNEL
jgi:hypothetical protein